MSTESLEQTLGGDLVPAHLTLNPDHRISAGLGVDVEQGEFYCQDCENRVTKNASNDNEYGHERGCSHHQVFGGGSA